MTHGGPPSKFADSPFSLIPTPAYLQKLEDPSQPSPLDPKAPGYSEYVEAASTMAIMHNAIIRGINSIYKQAPHIKDVDRRDFIGYALCWYEVLDCE
jgi:hypothetical protein